MNRLMPDGPPLRPGGRDGVGTQPPARGSTPSRRTLLAASTAAGLGLLTACAESSTGSTGADAKAPSGRGAPSSGGPSSPQPTRKRAELPRGGRKLFPRHRLVGYCGLPGAPALGRLGAGDLDARIDEMEKTAKEYAGDREPLPVLELLATVTNPGPGDDGTYRTRTGDDTIRDYYDAAARHDALLLLNIQPGRSSMLDEVKVLKDWLVRPEVGLALDPEWDMGPGEIPGDTYGSTGGREIAEIARWLSDLVEEHDLPEKALVFHQVSASVVPEHGELKSAPGVALIKSADGIGSPDLKRGTWKHLVKDLPEDVHTGFKLFYEEDVEGSRLMTPGEVLKLRPKPEYVMYE